MKRHSSNILLKCTVLPVCLSIANFNKPKDFISSEPNHESPKIQIINITCGGAYAKQMQVESGKNYIYHQRKYATIPWQHHQTDS